MQVLVFGSIYQGAMLGHVLEPWPLRQAHFGMEVVLGVSQAMLHSGGCLGVDLHHLRQRRIELVHSKGRAVQAVPSRRPLISQVFI